MRRHHHHLNASLTLVLTAFVVCLLLLLPQSSVAAPPTEAGGEYIPLTSGSAKLDPALRLALHLVRQSPSSFTRIDEDAKPASAEAANSLLLTKLARRIRLSLGANAPTATVLIHTTDTDEALAAEGVQLQARIGDVVTAVVPLAKLETIAALPGVVRIQADRLLQSTLDSSVPDTDADEVWQNHDTKGQGAILGLVDSGIDPFQADFIKPDGTTRIKYLLDFADPGDPDSDGLLNGPVYGGTVYSEADINAALANPGWFFRTPDRPLSIPDNSSSGVTSTINVAHPVAVTSVVVDLDIYHPYVSDLRVTLTCPSGTRVALHDRAGGDRDDILGSFTVTQCNGQPANGAWRLNVSDNANDDRGTLYFWNLHLNQTVRFNDQYGHGTHVAGILAGNGRSTGNGLPAGTYVGMAPEADIIAVRGPRSFIDGTYISDVVNGMAFIREKAEALGKPFVINLSLGYHLGPHDGTSLDERAIDNLVGASKPGRAVIVSAGNEGDLPIHASGRVAQGGSSTLSIQAPASLSLFVASIWYEGSDTFGLGFRAPNGVTNNPISMAPGRSGCFVDTYVDWLICFDHTGNNPYNGDKEVYIEMLSFVSGRWDVFLRGNTVVDGTYHAWIGASTHPTIGWTNPDNQMRVSIPGTARNAITVGAYVTKTEWTDPSGAAHTRAGTIGALSSFSSDGPTRDGRLKPEVVAPGQIVCSTVSHQARVGAYGSAYSSNSSFCRDGEHAAFSGTSMAAPHVAGAVGLLLALKPNLDAAQVKEALTQTTRRDGKSDQMPDNHWGYGKLQAKAAADQVDPQETVTPTSTASATATVTTTPTSQPSLTSTLTATRTPTPTASSTATVAPAPSGTLTPTGAATVPPPNTQTPTLTATPRPSSTPTRTATVTATPTVQYLLYAPIVVKFAPEYPYIPSLYFTQPSRDAVTLTWNVVSNAHGYILWHSQASNMANGQVLYRGPERIYRVEGLPPGTHYFRVQAVNNWGSTPSDIAVVSIVPPSPTPTSTPILPTVVPVPTSGPPSTLPTLIYSSADAMVAQFFPGVVAGDTVDFAVGYDDSIPAGILRGLMRFDLSAIPADAQIVEARLSLYLIERYDYPNRTRPATIYRAGGNWSEETLTWSNQPPIMEQQASLNIPTSRYGRYEFNITELVRGWVSQRIPNQGIFIRGPEYSGSDSSWMGFAAREASGTTYDPYLSIRYVGQAGTPTDLDAHAAPLDPSVKPDLRGKRFRDALTPAGALNP